MKIWYQSGGALSKDPSRVAYEQSLKRHIKRLVRPDTAVDVYGVDFAPLKLDSSYYSLHLNKSQIIRNAIRAERQGYDAFCIGCMLDPGYYEIREVVDIPVVFAAETAMHFACMLAPKFALLGLNEQLLLRISELVKSYGLSERMVKIGALNLNLNDCADGFENPKPVIDEITRGAREAAALGTDILICTCNVLNMNLVDHDLRQVDGVPILDAVGIAVKMAELLTDLNQSGITRSKRGLFTPLTKSEVATMLNMNNVMI